MKKNKKNINREFMSNPALNIFRFIVITCALSFSSHILISYFEGQIQFNFRPPVRKTNISETSFVSSVWCKLDPHDNSHKTCTFSNLCWVPSEEQFIFLLGEESILHGVADWRDLSILELSSVAGHNRFFLKIAVVGLPISEQSPLFHHTIIKENEWVYFLWRFKPDNIMHIVHDDLIPLYYAYEELCAGKVQDCVEKYKLIFVDDVNNDFAFDLYQMFSRKSPESGYSEDEKLLFLKDNWKSYNNTTICFAHASIGLPRVTSWFQYGFGKPQGAIEGSSISTSVIKRFTKFLLKQMEISVPDKVGAHSYENNHLPQRALYISRSVNRRILNEMDVISTTKDIYSLFKKDKSHLQVDYFNPAPNSSSSGLKEMLTVITQQSLPKLVFGMHSAALTVAAVVCLGMTAEDTDLSFLELFPLGINPVAVSPLKALFNVIMPQNSNHIFYEDWVNVNASNSVLPRVDSDPLVGGGDLCLELDLSSVLPAVECCHNKDYLCRMFQNTIVDTNSSFPKKLMSLFSQQKKYKAQGVQNQGPSHYRAFRWFFPASVSNIQCLWNITKDESHLVLSWNSPINIHMHSHHYAVAVTLEYLNYSKETTMSERMGQERIVPEVSVDLFLKVQNTSTTVTVPEQFINNSGHIIQALTWIQCVVSLKHMKVSKHTSSLDAFHKCSVKL
ncbi:protein O-linked-mannose beta-1,4-N-acetylglucosaminyltransferase 2-like [Hetaerina americana]|uniref:protein O-linked-mannose beta-1,4-N-acetylglucosaminyltransferase 2-like n=1 Tax=Hetaerina americana TaxID=62018 RepID=UPI003A7F55DC